jgi:hypothetical protein
MTTMTAPLLRTIRADRERTSAGHRPVQRPARATATGGRLGIVGAASAVLAVALLFGSLPSMAGAPAAPARPGPLPAPAAAGASATAAR